ncbi:hypothetical protein BMS3Abin16_00827 [archaeon BMS3Abin16]|nr:hypothetical protein BMS3Abin16_00827 [archaeon BMS3Abin16]
MFMAGSGTDTIWGLIGVVMAFVTTAVVFMIVF